MLMSFYLAQAVGIVMTVMVIISAQFRNMRTILISQIIINSLAMLNYVLLGGWSGAGINILAVAQAVWIYCYNRKGKKAPMYVGILFMLAYITVSAYSFDGLPSLLPLAGAIFYAAAVMQSDSGKYRICTLGNGLVWFLYDIYTHAYTTMFTHGFLMASILVAMVRIDLKAKKN